LFVRRASDHKQIFIFASHRSNLDVDYQGGVFLTKFLDSNAVFSKSVDCSTNCLRCNPKYPTKCLECASNYFLHKHQCHAAACPIYSYDVKDEGLNQLHYCKDCHYSCKTCVGSKKTQCASCCQSNACGAIKNRIPSAGQCLCDESIG